MIQLTGGIVDIEKRCKWISFWNESVSYLTWIAFIAVFSVHMKDLRNEVNSQFSIYSRRVKYIRAIGWCEENILLVTLHLVLSFYHNAINGTHIGGNCARKLQNVKRRKTRKLSISIHFPFCHPFNWFLVSVYAQFSSVFGANDAASIPIIHNTPEHSHTDAEWIWRVNRIEINIATRYFCCQSVVWSHSSLKKIIVLASHRSPIARFGGPMRFHAFQMNQIRIIKM